MPVSISVIAPQAKSFLYLMQQPDGGVVVSIVRHGEAFLCGFYSIAYQKEREKRLLMSQTLASSDTFNCLLL